MGPRASTASRVLPALLVVVALVGLTTRPLLSRRSIGASRHKAPATLVGVLEATPGYFAAEHRNDIGLVTLSVNWTQAEPHAGQFSASYAKGVNWEIGAALHRHLEVSLDLGLQYPPSWVFALPGGTRFVDQYGDAYRGAAGSGNNVANAVTDPAVRAAESTYLRWTGENIGRGRIVSVREGGGPFGELRYPGADFDGRSNCWWAYDASSQKLASLRWEPGTGTKAQAGRFLGAYDYDMDSYGIWLDNQVAADFTAERLLLLPGWGERPGGAAAVIASRLDASRAEFNQGLDWMSLVPALQHPSSTILYTTYLDAPSVRPTLQLEDPLEFLVHLARPRHFRLGGENTGDGSAATMDRVARRAGDDHLAVMNWMDQAQLVGDQRHGSTPTFATYHKSAIRYLSGGR